MKFQKKAELWQNVLAVLVEWDKADKKLDYYFEHLDKDKQTYALSRSYFLNVVKHKIFLEYFLKQYISKPPQRKMKCFLMLVVGQLWECFCEKGSNEALIPLINGWVDRSKLLFSPQECRFVNAILRKALSFFQTADTLPLTIRYDMPEFLLQRYLAYYGEAALLEYLKWNEGRITVYVRMHNCSDERLKKTPWPDFYILDAENWSYIFPLVMEKRAYIQDPMTRIPIELLQIKPGMSVLDLCAAPGGKTLQMVQSLNGTGHVVAVDLPEHMKRLESNMQGFPQVHLLGKDILKLSDKDFEQQQLPTIYDRVLIDVPCSNTGVVRRKPDVLYRLTPKDFDYLPKLQLGLLKNAGNFVKPGGLLVYSTCSIDPEENQGVVEQFLKGNNDFQLVDSHVSLPWIDQHDGGGAFCLRKL